MKFLNDSILVALVLAVVYLAMKVEILDKRVQRQFQSITNLNAVVNYHEETLEAQLEIDRKIDAWMRGQ